MKIGKKNYEASAVMIFPMVALTAAHNLYDRNIKEYAKELLFIPGKNGDEAKFGSYKVLKYYFPLEYKDDEFEDYAILFLERGDEEICPGLVTGFFGLKVINNIKEIENQILSICGFPGDKLNNNDDSEMWKMDIEFNKKNFKIENGVLSYKIFTYGGQSGSGVISEDKNILKVIGLHVCNNNNWKEGTQITTTRYNNIKNCITSVLLRDFKDKFKNEIERFFERDVQQGKYKGELNLNKNNLGREEIEILARLNLKNLEILNLSSNNLQKLGIKELSNFDFRSLKKLDLSYNDLGTKGIENFSKFKNLENLENLNLNNNNIGNDAMEFLIQMNFKNIKEIKLSKNRIDRKELDYFLSQMRNKYPKIRIK